MWLDRVEHDPAHVIRLDIEPDAYARLRSFLNEREIGIEACASHCFGSAFLAGWHSIQPGTALR